MRLVDRRENFRRVRDKAIVGEKAEYIRSLPLRGPAFRAGC